MELRPEAKLSQIFEQGNKKEINEKRAFRRPYNAFGEYTNSKIEFDFDVS